MAIGTTFKSRALVHVVGIALGLLCFAQPSSPDAGIGHQAACILRDGAEAEAEAVVPTVTTAAVAVPNYLAHLRGQQWNKPVVTVHLESSDTTRSPEDTTRILEKATRLWNEQVGGMVQLHWTEEATADITVRFVPSSQLPSRAIGRTDTRFRMVSRSLLHADVNLSQGMNDDRLEQVAAHEFGHALGMPGHSPSTSDLMYPITHTPARITERDRNTMCLNYQAIPAPYPLATVAPASDNR